MKASLGFVTIGILLMAVGVLAQERAPFAELDRQVRAQRGGWDGDKSVLSTVFDKERRQLGDKFEAELLKYISGDAEKHYWISAFLEDSGYLHGNKPLPQLALLVMEQGLSLLRNKTDETSVGLTVSLNVIAAVQSQELGLPNLATSHKNDAERLLTADSDWHAYFPAMSEDELKTYDAVPSSYKSVRSSPPNDDSSGKPRTRVSGGVLNGRASSLPIPRYPPSARGVSSQVVVGVVFDETGKVIWAHAMSGHPLLQKAAEEAALKATFPPFKLEGKPEKVYGVLIYNFVK